MRFGELLSKRSLKGYRYLNYELLKESIMLSNFYSLLMTEVMSVDEFFETNSRAQTYEYAAINYIAVLKILKKHEKLSNKKLHVNFEKTKFGCALANGILAVESLDACFCPICISDNVTSGQLPCSHSICFECLKKMNSFGMHACPICRSQLSNCNKVVDDILGKPSTKYHDENLKSNSKSSNRKKIIKVMTWNVCALSFPLHISWIQFSIGLLLTGVFQTHDTCDVPLYISEERIKKQADFIKKSEADVVMLQEVLDEKTVFLISTYLPEYKPVFCLETISYTNKLMFLICAFCVACVQGSIINEIFCLRFSIVSVLTVWNAWRWRNSTLASFLCGRVKGQLVTFTKQKSLLINKTFVTFDIPKASSSWSMFFLSHFRQRGLLKYRFNGIDFINTHIPHGLYQSSCYETIKRCCKMKPFVLGGDFNPLPGIRNEDLFQPITELSLIFCKEKHVTWNLEEPLTRKAYLTPYNMQLDYILHTEGKSKTNVLCTELSDHYALTCEFHPEEDIFTIEE